MSQFNKAENIGSFSFCKSCPSNKNCCTRMRTNSSIDNAIVFNEEIEEIERFSGIDREEFLQTGRYPQDWPYQTLKHEGLSGCYFHRDGRCKIYSVRPLDCRFFPFDIIEDDEGNLNWIVYIDLCPVDFDYRESFQKLKGFLIFQEIWRCPTPGGEPLGWNQTDTSYWIASIRILPHPIGHSEESDRSCKLTIALKN